MTSISYILFHLRDERKKVRLSYFMTQQGSTIGFLSLVVLFNRLKPLKNPSNSLPKKVKLIDAILVGRKKNLRPCSNEREKCHMPKCNMTLLLSVSRPRKLTYGWPSEPIGRITHEGRCGLRKMHLSIFMTRTESHIFARAIRKLIAPIGEWKMLTLCWLRMSRL